MIGRGGDVWTKDLGDGNTLAVRLDPPNPRATLKGGEPRADQVPHAHKELIPTSEVVNGNYSSQAPGKTTLNDLGQPSTDPTETHIPIKP